MVKKHPDKIVVKLPKSARRLYFVLFSLTCIFTTPTILFLYRDPQTSFLLLIFPAISLLGLWLAIRPASITLTSETLTIVLGFSKKSYNWLNISNLNHRPAYGGHALIGNLRSNGKTTRVKLGKFDVSLNPEIIIENINTYQLSVLRDKLQLKVYTVRPAHIKSNKLVKQISVDDPVRATINVQPDLGARFKSLMREDISERKYTYNLGRIESDDTQLVNFYIQYRGKSFGNPYTYWRLVLEEIEVTFYWADYEHQVDGRVKIVIGNITSNRGRERDNFGKLKPIFTSPEEQDNIISLFVEAMNAAFKSNVHHPSKPRPFDVNVVMSDKLQNRLDRGI